MIYLLLCVVISVLILVSFKYYAPYKVNQSNAIVISYFVSFVLALVSVKGEQLSTDFFVSSAFLSAFVTGITFYLGFRLFALTTHKIGLAVTSISGNMSVVIPVLFALLFYHEEISLIKASGLVLALLSFYLILKPEKGLHVDKNYIYLPLILFLVTGVNAVMISLSQRFAGQHRMWLLMSVIFLFAFVFGMLVSLFNKNKKPWTRQDMLAALLLGVLNYGSTSMIFKSLEVLPATVFFPGYNAGYIVLAALTGVLWFKERLHPLNWLGMALAVLAVIIITSGF